MEFQYLSVVSSGKIRQGAEDRRRQLQEVTDAHIRHEVYERGYTSSLRRTFDDIAKCNIQVRFESTLLECSKHLKNI